MDTKAIDLPIQQNRSAQEPGAINPYRCDTCGGVTVTIHRDAGVTPFMIGCRVTPGCNGRAYSSFYPPVLAANLVPRVVWFRCAGEDELVAALRRYPRLVRHEVRRHHEMGGCLEQDLPARFPVIHLRCAGIAFLFDSVPQPGDPMIASRVSTLIGDRMRPGGLIACGSCRVPVSLHSEDLCIEPEAR